MSNTVAVSDSTIQGSQSAYNWYTSGSTYMLSINPGAYLTPGFTGTSLSVGVDVSVLMSNGLPPTYYPVVKYSVDGGAYTSTRLVSGQTSITVATGLTDTTHTFFIVFTGSDAGGNDQWWNGNNALRITNFTVDTGRVTVLNSQTYAGTYWALGDSITAGVGALNNPVFSLAEDPTLGYQALIAAYFGRPYGNVAFSGQGWTGTSSGVPPFPSTYNLILSGVSRTFTPVPSLITVNEGSNSAPSSSADVVTMLGNLRACGDANTVIFLIIPFNQSAVTVLTNGYNTYHASNPTEKTYLLDLGSAGASVVTANSYDGGSHPNATGYAILAGMLEPLMQPYLLNQASGMSGKASLLGKFKLQ